MELDPKNDTVYDNMTFASNVNLEFDEEGKWIQQVQDWESFWFDRDDDEMIEHEEELYSGMTAFERTEAALNRASECRGDGRHRGPGEARVVVGCARQLW